MAKTLKIDVGELNIEIRRGLTFNPVLAQKNADTGEIIPFTGGTKARMQIRDIDDNTIIYADLDSDGGSIVVDEANGTIQPIISSTDTSAWSLFGGIYDIEIEEPTGEVKPFVGGTFIVNNEVTA